MPERRKSVRRPINYYIQVMDSTTQKLIGNLANVSSIGIMIDGRIPMSIGTDVHIRMDTTPDVADVPYINFTGRVKWCTESKMAPGIFDIGMEFVHISQANIEILTRIADKYGS